MKTSIKVLLSLIAIAVILNAVWVVIPNPYTVAAFFINITFFLIDFVLLIAIISMIIVVIVKLVIMIHARLTAKTE